FAAFVSRPKVSHNRFVKLSVLLLLLLLLAMLKSILYLSVTFLGILLALVSPLAGVILNIAAYLANPQIITNHFTDFRYQFYSAIAMITGIVLQNPRPLPPSGKEGVVLKALWLYMAIAIIGCPFAVVDSDLAWEYAFDFFKTVLVTSLFLFGIRSERDMVFVTWACLIGTAHAAFLQIFGSRFGWLPAAYGRSGYEGGLVDILPDPSGAVMSIFLPCL